MRLVSWERRTAIGLLVWVVLLVVATRAARGRAEGVLLHVASVVSERAARGAAAESILVNGIRFEIAVATREEGLTRALDRARGDCSRDAGLSDDLHALRASDFASLRGFLRALVFDGALRAENETHGVVACLVPQDPWTVKSLARSLRELAPELDVGKLGAVRLTSARSDGAGRTTVVTVTSRGPVPLRRAFPVQGDAPGEDVPGVPRVGSSARVLAVGTVERGPELAMYRLPSCTVEEALRVQREQLVRDGLRVVDVEHGPNRGFFVERGSTRAVIAVTDRAGGQPYATVLSL